MAEHCFDQGVNCRRLGCGERKQHNSRVRHSAIVDSRGRALVQFASCPKRWPPVDASGKRRRPTTVGRPRSLVVMLGVVDTGILSGLLRVAVVAYVSWAIVHVSLRRSYERGRESYYARQAVDD